MKNNEHQEIKVTVIITTTQIIISFLYFSEIKCKNN